MMTLPQATSYRPERKITQIADIIGDTVAAARFPDSIVRFRNDRWDRRVGLDQMDEAAWISHFGRFQALPGSLPSPLALRYHGHQFRHYNPDIGDGRGFLFAQLRDDAGRLLDLGTKGSGQTPYSRFGDGRLTLKGGVREVLATEMLEALGVNTSKSFSLIETGEQLSRNDEPSPTRSSVLVRLSHGHIRIGSFQRLAFLEDKAALQRLTDYCLAALYGVDGGSDAPATLLRHVVGTTADLAASYMIAGFVHGVLNSDNIAISGESFDYGPWRFTPYWDDAFVAAYFDQSGLYAFGRQAEAIAWNLWQLGNALALIGDNQSLEAALDGFAAAYRAALARHFARRLGIAGLAADSAIAGLTAAITGLRAQKVTIDQFFHDWRRGDCPPERADRYAGAQWAAWVNWINGQDARQRDPHPYWAAANACSMHIAEVEQIWAAIADADDWQPFYSKIMNIRAMGDALSAA